MTRHYFFSQPHQLFFSAGMLWAALSMLLFALGYQAVINFTIDLLFFHTYTLFFIVFTQFFVGFIFTTFPRFCQSEMVQKRSYINIFFLLQLAAVLFVAGALTNAFVATGGVALLLLAHIMILWQLQKVYRGGSASRFNSDPFWILVGFYSGLAAHLLFLIDRVTPIFSIAATIGFWNYLAFTAFSVAQRMVPFFSHSVVKKRAKFAAIVFFALALHTLFALLERKTVARGIDFVLGLYLLVELFRWKLNTKSAPAILWILHLALYWFAAALILSVISVNFASLHLMAIGFVTTLFIGFGTRVTLGHSQQAPHADRYTVLLFFALQALVIVRALFAFFSGAFWLFDLSAAIWIAIYLLWINHYGAVLINGKKLGV